MDATFWLNGVKIGWHGYGYTSFRLDCGGAWRPGRNVLAVRVDNSHMPNSRWYSGSGIFRTVWLIRTGDVAIDLFGVRCAANGIYPEEDAADLQIHECGNQSVPCSTLMQRYPRAACRAASSSVDCR